MAASPGVTHKGTEPRGRYFTPISQGTRGPVRVRCSSSQVWWPSLWSCQDLRFGCLCPSAPSMTRSLRPRPSFTSMPSLVFLHHLPGREFQLRKETRTTEPRVGSVTPEMRSLGLEPPRVGQRERPPPRRRLCASGAPHGAAAVRVTPGAGKEAASPSRPHVGAPRGGTDAFLFQVETSSLSGVTNHKLCLPQIAAGSLSLHQ